ncbi:DUF2730 family protein [Chelativorans alearense]|uniref:DUF2730 family protein n=1 Tax=Chelativorans alearense TaxID=2681495 RepID=UPI0013D4EF7D|nr:DUF2730 family protein [Chelativorans alearense]
MEVATMLPWLIAVNTLISIGTAVYAVLTSRSDANAKGLAEVDGTLKEQDRRIQALENEVAHLPDREQWHRLELAMEKLSGRMGTLDERLSGRIETLNERLQPVQAIATRLQELEFERDK